MLAMMEFVVAICGGEVFPKEVAAWSKLKSSLALSIDRIVTWDYSSEPLNFVP